MSPNLPNQKQTWDQEAGGEWIAGSGNIAMVTMKNSQPAGSPYGVKPEREHKPDPAASVPCSVDEQSTCLTLPASARYRFDGGLVGLAI